MTGTIHCLTSPTASPVHLFHAQSLWILHNLLINLLLFSLLPASLVVCLYVYKGTVVLSEFHTDANTHYILNKMSWQNCISFGDTKGQPISFSSFYRPPTFLGLWSFHLPPKPVSKVASSLLSNLCFHLCIIFETLSLLPHSYRAPWLSWVHPDISHFKILNLFTNHIYTVPSVI